MYQNSGAASPAYAYVPPQSFEQRYSDDDAIIRGTLFPELDLPFQNFSIARRLPNTPSNELAKLSFVRHELRLYCDTHPQDTKAYSYLKEYERKVKQAGETNETDWVNGAWPWEREA